MTYQFPPEKILTVTLHAQEWGTVLAGLHELPAKFSLSVIARLQEQFDAQAPRGQPAENGIETEQTA